MTEYTKKKQCLIRGFSTSVVPRIENTKSVVGQEIYRKIKIT